MIVQKFSLRSSILSLFLGFIGTVFLVIFFTDSPLYSLQTFFITPLSNTYYFGSLLNTASLLLFSSLGMIFSFKSGYFNLGGEGQIYIGGLLTSILLSSDFFSAITNKFLIIIILIIVCLFISFISGLISGVSAVLKEHKNVNELLSSFLFSAALIPILDSLITTYLRDPSGNLLATPMINEKFKLFHILPPSSLTISCFIGILLCVITFFFFTKNRYGKQFILCGCAKEFALYSGFKAHKNRITGMFFSGFFHGMCGFFAICGMYFTCHQGFYTTWGWNAIAVALIAGSNPLLLIPSALILSYFFTASDIAVNSALFSFNLTPIIQSIIFLTITIQIVSKKKRESK